MQGCSENVHAFTEDSAHNVTVSGALLGGPVVWWSSLAGETLHRDRVVAKSSMRNTAQRPCGPVVWWPSLAGETPHRDRVGLLCGGQV